MNEVRSIQEEGVSLPTSGAPSAPELSEIEETGAPVVVATAKEKQNFEWNVGRLYSNQENHSAVRTWAVRVLSTVLVFPLVLTLLLDLGRRAAFSFGIVNGKSWSLIDKASQGCKKAADKVKAIYESCRSASPKTIDQLNQLLEQKMQKHSQKLVDAYRALNGGYFSNTSFSSPAALNAEKQIRKEQVELIRALNTFVSQNTASAKDLKAHLDSAKNYIFEQIIRAAKDDVYVENKVSRTGPRQSLANVVCREFLEVVEKIDQPVIAAQYIELAKREPDVAKSLKEGVDQHMISQGQAKFAISQYAPELFNQTLEKGLEEASQKTEDLLFSARTEGLVSSEEEEEISRVPSDVKALAKAASLDVVRNSTEETADDVVRQQLVKTSESLIDSGRLNREDQSRFLTEAVSKIKEAKRAIELELAAKQQAEEAQRLEAQLKLEAEEAQKAQEVQKAKDQTSLLNTFVNTLQMFGTKQEELSSLHDEREQLKIQEKALGNRIESLRKEMVEVRGNSVSILKAAGEYAKALVSLSKKSITDEQKGQKLKELEEQGFTKQTIQKIHELEAFTKELESVIKQEVSLSEMIKEKHPKLEELYDVYKGFRKHHLKQLEQENQRLVQQIEKGVLKTQDSLTAKYRTLLGLSFYESLTFPTVDRDAAASRLEVEKLLKEFAVEDEIPLEEASNEEEILPSATEELLSDFIEFSKGVVTAPFKWIGIPQLIARWNRPASVSASA